MSYPSTLTYKDVLNLKDLITLLFGWLGDVLGCVWVFSELQPTLNDRGEPIYIALQLELAILSR